MIGFIVLIVVLSLGIAISLSKLAKVISEKY